MRQRQGDGRRKQQIPRFARNDKLGSEGNDKLGRRRNDKLGRGGDELQNFGAGRGGPPSRFLVSVADKGDKVQWNQHLWKC